MRYDCLILSPARQRREIDEGVGAGGQRMEWGVGLNFAPSCARLDTRQSYLIEFLVVLDHFFVRILSSVGSLWSHL